jgi:hypothetical protein
MDFAAVYMWCESLNNKPDIDTLAANQFRIKTNLVQNQFSYEKEIIYVITTGSDCHPDWRSYYP